MLLQLKASVSHSFVTLLPLPKKPNLVKLPWLSAHKRDGQQGFLGFPGGAHIRLFNRTGSRYTTEAQSLGKESLSVPHRDIKVTGASASTDAEQEKSGKKPVFVLGRGAGVVPHEHCLVRSHADPKQPAGLSWCIPAHLEEGTFTIK